MKRPNLIVNVKHYLYNGHGSSNITGYTCESFHVNLDGTVTYFSSGSPHNIPLVTCGAGELPVTR